MNNSIWSLHQSDKITKTIETSPFYIFGTGVIGERFFLALKDHGNLNNFCGFIVSKKEDDYFYGEEVFGIDDKRFDKNILICVAVHDAIFQEVESALDECGATDRIWIYPYLLELELGTPLKRGVKKDVRELMSNIECINPYAIYYLAIEDIDIGNGIGQDAYIWLYSRTNTMETARKRLSKLRSRVYDFNRQEYDDYPIRIFENGELIADGAHRLTLSRYFDIQDIVCDEYKFNKEQFYERMKWFFITENDLKGYFSNKDYTQIQYVISKLKDKK